MAVTTNVRIYLKFLLLAFILLAGMLLGSCNDKAAFAFNYPQDKNVSDPLGYPTYSQSLYFPFIINDRPTGIDSLPNSIQSFKMNLMNEPVLSNYYLNNDLFRLTLFPSFERMKTIKLCKSGNDIHVIVKTLDKNEILFPGFAKATYLNEDGTMDTTRQSEDKTYPAFSSRSFILKNEWKELCNHVSKVHFSEIPNTNNYFGLDGIYYILEQHTFNNYWFVRRWEPCMRPQGDDKRDCDFKLLIGYILQLTEGKENL